MNVGTPEETLLSVPKEPSETKELSANSKAEPKVTVPDARSTVPKQPSGTYLYKGGTAYVPLKIAMQLTGASKTTFHRKTTNGDLGFVTEDDGTKIYQIPELERVFGTLKPLEPKGTVPNEPKKNQTEPKEEQGETALKVALLEEKLRHAEEMKVVYQQQAERAELEAEHWREQAASVARMLTYQPQTVIDPEPEKQAIAPKTEPIPEPPKGFLSRLFGGR